PSRSFLDMRDKTSWSTDDDIAIWDARPLFQAGKAPGNNFCHDRVTSLPRLYRDLEFGDIALVYYGASTYPVSRAVHAEASIGLSLNLYGVVLIASRNF
ncbi:hypothetical protein C8Q76DRAFT_624765, partial [Earliella scabrosa]